MKENNCKECVFLERNNFCVCCMDIIQDFEPCSDFEKNLTNFEIYVDTIKRIWYNISIKIKGGK